MEDSELMEALGNAQVRFWVCPDCPGQQVTWHESHAVCDICGNLSCVPKLPKSLDRKIARIRISWLNRRIIYCIRTLLVTNVDKLVTTRNRLCSNYCLPAQPNHVLTMHPPTGDLEYRHPENTLPDGWVVVPSKMCERL